MTWTENVPRDTDHYWPSIHASQQRKHRNIEWIVVAETIKHGEIKKSHKDDCCLFVHDLRDTDEPVGVVANYETGEILTVEWRRE